MSHNSMKILKAAPEMDDREDIFSNLPPEIILNILSRILIETVFTCKCVCKSWLELLDTPEFARSHLSNSVPGLLTHRFDLNGNDADVLKVFRFEDSLEVERHELHYKRVLELKSDNLFGVSSPLFTLIEGSINGLLFFLKYSYPIPDDYYICNPITHECLKLPTPEGIAEVGSVVTHGFGMSRLSNQYKVVRIFQEGACDPDTGLFLGTPNFVWQVYILGTGSWRSITTPREMLLHYGCSSTGKLLNGNLHWLTTNSMGSLWISCFDLEDEAFTKFPAPTEESAGSLTELGVLRDCMCLSDFSSKSEIVVYLMNDDGYEKKWWNREYVISKVPVFSGESFEVVYAIKAFADGDLLLLWEHNCLLCYSTRTKTMALADVLNVDVEGYFQAILYTPCLISLKDFETENAKLFEFVCSMS